MLTFLTFANTSYMTSDKIVDQAKKFKIFDNILGMTELDIPDFVNKHKKFIDMNKAGYGLWIWKPKIILDTLSKLEENDLLIYCDAGIYLNINGKERMFEYVNILQRDDNFSMITFSTNDNYKAQYFVKSDAVMNFYPQFNNELNNSCYAGLIIFKKNKHSLHFVNEWLGLCENYHFIDKSPSYQFKETPIFLGNDCDNGLFNLCLSKHKISYSIYPDEANIYDDNGNQLHHSTTINYKNVNWDLLDKNPFQIRRMTPKFGY